jgi:hypothetical protein
MAFSHKLCAHEATPAGRRACRTSGVAGAVKVAVAKIDAHGGPEKNIYRGRQGEIRRQADRMKAGAVPTECIQAALHIDAHGGRCACGWEAAA